MIAVRDGWKGLTEGVFAPLGRREVSGILPRGGTILGTTRTNPYKIEGGVEAVLGTLPRSNSSTLSSRSGVRTRSASPRGSTGARVSGRRCSEDDRQRPLGHGLHVRVRHRHDDRDRGDRPAAHDRGVAQPRDGRRGHGQAHRLDRRHERDRRWRGRDPHPRAADHGRARLRGARQAARGREGLLDRRRERGLRAHL